MGTEKMGTEKMGTEKLRPMLATAGPVPGGPGWAFEFTWDGVRSLADVYPRGIRLIGGTDRGVAASYPELDALPELARGRRMLLDGTIVALDAVGRPSLARLRQRSALPRPSARARSRVPVAYYVFDLLRLDDDSTLTLPYRERRELLARLGLTGGPVMLSPYFLDTDGQTVLDTAAQYGLKGVTAKRAESGYHPGRRSRSWVETALRRTQEVIIGGWLPDTAGELAALLVGLPTDRGLTFLGAVRTGFDRAARAELGELVRNRERSSSPFVDRLPDSASAARWVAPELLGEVAYREWTAAGRLAHPTWRGLHPGKHPAALQTPVVLRGAGRPAPDPDDQRELEEGLARARADLDALRAQIVPHFLYNTLSTIAAFVRTDPPRARELLMDFADFTRYSFSSTTSTTLAAEIDNVERYLTLERARLGSRLDVAMQIAPGVLGVELPFLAVQLLVEQAVRDRIEDAVQGGTVTITATAAGSECMITVADDTAGAGAVPDLGGVDGRLRGMLGERYTLAAESEPGAGTTVTLRVPVGAAPRRRR